MRVRPGRRSVLVVVAALAAVGTANLGWPISGADSEEARAAAVRLLTADVAVGQMPADLTDRKREFETGAPARREALSKIWFPLVARYQARNWEEGLRSVVNDRWYRAYVDNKYVVTDWRSIRRVPGGFLVVFRGHMNYRDAKSGEWGGSQAATEHLIITRVAGDWRLMSEFITDYNPS